MKIVGIRCFSSCVRENDSYILSAARTPIGSFLGKLNSLTLVDLGCKALVPAVERSKVAKEDIGELILGCVFESGLGQHPARQIGTSSGLPSSVIATSMNALCNSGLKSTIFGCQMIMTNSQEVVAVVGAESISNTPYVLKRKAPKIGHLSLLDTILHDGLIDIGTQNDVTAFAELTAKEYNYTREIQDEFALKSYEKAAAAYREGLFSNEIIPVVLKKKGNQEEIVAEDEEIRRLNVEKFRTLTPDMGKGGTITAGNSSGLCDGAAAIVLASGKYVLKNNLEPLARIVSFGECSVDIDKFCAAPSIAVPQALARANLSAEDICRWEISETFAITPLLNAKILKVDLDRVNPHGGAISMGHPFGMTGVRIMAHLVYTLKSGELGCACISSGAGGAAAIIIEKN